MRSPGAADAGHAVQRAVVDASGHLTTEALIFDAVSAAHAIKADPEWRPPMWPGKEAVAAGRAAVRALEPPDTKADSTPRPKPALWRRVLWRLAEVGL